MPDAATTEVLYVVHRSARNRLLNLLVDALPRVRFTVVTLDDPGELDADLAARGVEVHHLPGVSVVSSPVAARHLAGLVGQLEPDLVQSNGYVPSLVVELVHRLRRHAPPSVLARHHNREHHVLGRGLHVRLDGWAARSASAVIAVSPAVRDTLVEEGVAADRISVAPNGVDWARVTVDPAARDRWRAELGGESLLVAVGRLDPIKDLPTSLRALAGLRASGTDARLAIAGTGPDGAQARLEAEAERLGVRSAVTFLGWVPQVFDLVAAADVFVQSSLDESFGQSVLEAGGLGVPVAVTTVGGVVDLVPPDHPAIAPGDHAALESRVVDLLADPAGSRARAERAATDLRARFTMEAMAGAHLRTYAAVTGTAVPST